MCANLIAVPFFLGLGIFVAAENGLLFRSLWFRSGVRVALAANLALTAGVWFTCFVVRSPLGYPTFAGLSPTPIERAIKRGVPMRGAALSAAWAAGPVLTLYARAAGYTFQEVDDASFAALPCVSGNTPPTSAIRIDNSVVIGLLCY